MKAKDIEADLQRAQAELERNMDAIKNATGRRDQANAEIQRFEHRNAEVTAQIARCQKMLQAGTETPTEQVQAVA